MIRIIIISFSILIFQNINAQVDSCGSQFPICDFNTIDSFIVSNPVFTEVVGGSVCNNGGGGEIHNPLWFSFVAGNEEIVFDYKLTNCVPGSIIGCTGEGIQIVVWSGCPNNGGTCIGGSSDCIDINTVGSISVSNFEIGGVYHLLIDGCCGSTCTIELEINVTDWTIEIPDTDDITVTSKLDLRAGCDEIAPNVYCPDVEIFFTAEGRNGIINMDDVEGRYSWTIIGPSPESVRWDVVSESGNGPVVEYGTLDENSGNIVAMTFSELGDYEICFLEAETYCDKSEGSPKCHNITIVNPESQDFGIFNICYPYDSIDQFSFYPPNFIDATNGIEYEWNDGEPITIKDIIENNGLLSVTFINDCCSLEQTIQINLIGSANSEFTEISLFQCQFPYQLSINGEELIIEEAISYQQVLPEATVLPDFIGNRCDSLIIINVNEVVLLDSLVIKCVPDGISVEAVLYREDTMTFELKSPFWIWKDAITDTVIDSGSNLVVLDEGSSYYLEYSGFIIDPNTGLDFHCNGVFNVFELEAMDVSDSSVIIQYPDSDEDGFGADSIAVYNCMLLSGYVTNNQDCNDSDTEINPDATEIPNNGIDENCDGEVILSSTYNLGTSSLRVFPNPTRDYLHIEVNNKQELYTELYNISGKLIAKTLGVMGIDLSAYPDGIYNLILRDKNDSVIVKVLKH